MKEYRAKNREIELKILEKSNLKDEVLKKLTLQREELTEERNRLKILMRETVKKHGVKIEQQRKPPLTPEEENIKQNEAWKVEQADFDKKIA